MMGKNDDKVLKHKGTIGNQEKPKMIKNGQQKSNVISNDQQSFQASQCYFGWSIVT